MFTGIIRNIGTIKEIKKDGENATIWISSDSEFVDSLSAGDSISINGACLTVLEKKGDSWSHHLMVETLDKTNLSNLKEGSPVNLEKPLVLNQSLDGHFVMGHIDGVAKLEKIEDNGADKLFTFKPPETLLPLIIPKGSIAIDGTSLTVAELDKDTFTVSLFPYTLEHTIFGQVTEGHQANIEVDMIGKYVQRLTNLHQKNEQ